MIDLTELAAEATAVTAHIDGQVRDEAVRSLLNVVGTSIGAARAVETDRLVAGLRCAGATGDVPVPGRADTFDPASAALVTAYAAHLDDFDDTHLATVVHPGASVFGAALGATALRDVSGDELLRAFAAGIELQLRIAIAMSPSHYDAGWHITGTVGLLGAAMTASILLGLDAEAAGRALGVATSMTLGHREGFGTMNKALHPGKGGRQRAGRRRRRPARAHGVTCLPRRSPWLLRGARSGTRPRPAHRRLGPALGTAVQHVQAVPVRHRQPPGDRGRRSLAPHDRGRRRAGGGHLPPIGRRTHRQPGPLGWACGTVQHDPRCRLRHPRRNR